MQNGSFAEQDARRYQRELGMGWVMGVVMSLGLLSLMPASARADDVEAGPLWNHAEAQQRCPNVCAPRQWTGQWRTTRPGQMSVCQCEGGFIPQHRQHLGQPGVFRELPGRARDIGVGANGSAWVIGTGGVNGGYGIYNWNGSAWVQVPGGGVRIAVGPDGQPWVVNNNNDIFQRVGNNWRQLPGRAQDIGVGANGQAWVIGMRPAGGGGSAIYFWNGGNWTEVDGAAVRIAVGPDGTPWVVNRVGNIYHRENNRWQPLPGQATDIGVGADGKVWIIGTNAVPGGFGIYVWNGAGFQPIEGGATNISVGPNGMPWVTNSENRIYVREAVVQPVPQPMPPQPMPMPPGPDGRGRRGSVLSANGKCLDAHGQDYDARINGGRILSYDCHAGANQQWRLDNGALVAGNGKCLDVHGPDFDRRINGGKVQLWDCHGGPNQQWNYNGSALVSANGKCLDLHGGDFESRANGGKVQVWDCHGGANQQWAIRRHGGGGPGHGPGHGPGQLPPPIGYPPPPPPAPVVMPMPPDRFNQMYGAVRGRAFIDERINAMKDYMTPESYFTTRQLIQLMQVTAFGSERIRIATLLWPRVVDPDNFPDVVAIFTFESERQELRRKLGR